MPHVPNWFKSWFTPFFKTRQETIDSPYRLCLQIGPKEALLVLLEKETPNLTILLNETIQYSDLAGLPQTFSNLIKDKKSQVKPSLLLSPDDYQLFLIESLPVAIDEFQEALRWRIRSLIAYPIEDAVIDHFPLPVKKTGSDSMVVAVVSRRDQLWRLSEVVKKSGMQVEKIDIPELAMRTLTGLYEQDEKSTAFLYFFENAAILNITSQKQLYFTRRMNWTMSNTTLEAKDLEQVSLDILRYFDFFQSQWRFPSPNRVFVGAEKMDVSLVAKLLSQFLYLTVEPYSFPNDKTISANAPKETLQPYLLVTGCALIEDKADAAPGN